MLIVDDDPLVRDLLQAVLTDDLFDVRVAVNGEEALALADEVAPDLVVLDVMMPGVDGFDVCASLRARFPAVRIVMLTAHVSDGAESAARAVGADAFLTKPFSPLVLRDLLEPA